MAYNGLTEVQKALVTNVEKLTAAEKKVAELEADKAAEEETNSFKTTHASILGKTVGTIDVSDKEAVKAALTAYELLSDLAKAKVIVEKALLDNLLGKINELETDKAAADAVIEKIKELPSVENLTLEYNTAVQAARSVYNALTKAQKDLVTNILTLEAAEAKIKKLVIEDIDRRIDAAIEKLKLEGTGISEITYREKKATFTIDEPNTDIINFANSGVLSLFLEMFKDVKEAKIGEHVIRPEGMTEVQLKAAIGQYLIYPLIEGAETRNLKELVGKHAEAELKIVLGEETYPALYFVEFIASDKALAIQAAINAICDLPEAEDIKLTDKDAVIAARNLVNIAKEKGAKDSDITNLGVLTAAERKITELEADKAAAEDANRFKSIYAQILDKKLATISINDRGAVEAALDAYDKLSELAQGKLAIEKALLDSLLAKIEELETDKAAADAVINKIYALPSLGNLTLGNKEAVEEARTAYDKLSDEQKALIDVEVLEKLTAAERKVAELEADKAANNFKTEHSAVLEKTVETVAIDDKDAVNAAKEAYGLLSDLAKGKLTAENTLLDKLLVKIGELETEAANVKEATKAVEAYETGPITTLEEVAAAEALELTANEKVAQLASVDIKSGLEARISARKAEVAAAKADLEATAEANGFKEAHASILGKTIDTVEIDDKGAVNAALTAYGELAEPAKTKAVEEKALLDSLLTKITKLEADKAAADAVINKINALPEVDELILEDKAEAEAARAAYEALTEEQKALVGAEVLGKLTAAEARIVKIEDDIAALNEAKATAGELKGEDYTASTWSAFQTAYTTALVLPETTNAEVVNKTLAINNAMAMLIKRTLLIVTVSNTEVEYGKKAEFTVTYSGFKEGGTPETALKGNLIFEHDYKAGDDAGLKFSVTPKGLSADDYTIQYVSGTLTVTKAKLMITAEDKTSIYGEELKELTYTLEGTNYNDEVEITLTKKEGSDVGQYDIIVSASHPNYDISLKNGTYTITKATINQIGDEKLGDLYVVNRDYKDNAIKSDNIGSVSLKAGMKDVTNEFTCKFYDGENGKEITKFDLSNGGTTFKVYVEADNISGNVEDYSGYVIFKYRSVTIGNNDIFYTIEDALAQANSGIVYVKYNTSFADEEVAELAYEGTDFTVKKNVTLLLPYSNALSQNTDDTPGNSTGGVILRNNAYVKLTMPSGIELKVDGALTVNAMRAAISTRFCGHVTGSNYAQLYMEESSKITVENGGTLNCIGFIYGEGTVEAMSGSSVYESMFIKSFRGGTATSKVGFNVFPFDQYTINNIEVDFTVNNGASHITRSLIYMSSRYYKGDLKLVGSDKNYLIQLTGGQLIRTYDTKTGQVMFDFHGDASINIGKINVSGITADSDGKDMPFDGTWRFNFAPSSNISIDSWVVLLPGASMNIESGANVTITDKGRLTVFDPYEHLDDYNSYPVKAESYYRVAPTFGYKGDTSANLTVNGTLIVEGGLAGRVHVGHNGSINQTASAFTTYDIKYVAGTEGSATANSREVTLWNGEDATIAVVANPSTVVTKDQTKTTVTATVRDGANNPLQGIEVSFEGGKGSWNLTSGITDKNGKATAVYTTSTSETAGTLLLTATEQEGNKTARANLIVKASSGGSCPFVYSYDGEDYHFEHESIPFAVNSALETTSYGTLRKLKAVDGKYHIKVAEMLDEKSFVNVFELKAVDYMTGQGIKEVFADIFGEPHTIKERIVPIEFVDSNGDSRLEEITAKDQMVGSDRNKLYEGEYVTSYTATFNKPQNVTNIAKLMVRTQKTYLITQSWAWVLDKLDATDNMWWMEKVMGLQENRDKFVDFINMVNLRVELWDGEKWIEQGHIKAGMDLLEEFLIPLDISMIDNKMDNIKVRFTSGTGFYEIDQVSIDFSEDQIINVVELEPETVLFNEGQDVKMMISDFNDDNRVRMVKGDKVDLYYNAPELREGYERGFMVALKGYYHMGPDSKENPIVNEWDNLDTSGIINALYALPDEKAIEAMPAFVWMSDLIDSLYNAPLEEKIEKVIVDNILPWLNSEE